jgi:hypothetical protein
MRSHSESGASCYLALIGDIKRSRGVTERAALQRAMESSIGAANARFSGDTAADFALTLGDEFQGLLRKPDAVVDVIRTIDASLEGARVRYGVGWGELSTDLKDVAFRMDGPCFHRAREALLDGKREDRWVTVSGFGEDDEVLNGLFWLIGAVLWQWTDIQRQTVSMIRSAGSQKEVAQARGVSVSAVSKALKSAMHEQVLAAERSAARILGRYDPAAESVEEVKR